MNAYIKTTERSQINDLIIHLKLPEKQEQSKSQNKQKERNKKISAEINEIEATTIKKKYKELRKQKAGSLKK
jgi:hypothetical protein